MQRFILSSSISLAMTIMATLLLLLLGPSSSSSSSSSLFCWAFQLQPQHQPQHYHYHRYHYHYHSTKSMNTARFAISTPPPSSSSPEPKTTAKKTSTKSTTSSSSSSPSSIAVISSTSSSSTSSTSIIIPNTMEEGIYNFNKRMIDTVYDIICFLYPVKGNERDFVRFYVLETVARVPYFAYLSVMHLRETFGERYTTMSDRMRTHYAQADNELHHLLIMESLGGNSNIIDRTIAQTMAFVYYWYVILIYIWKEPAAYHLSELIEDHAYHTYDGFTKNHQEWLQRQDVPDIARKYYERDNPFLFDLFCTVKDDNVQSDNDDNNDNNNNNAVLYSQRRPKLQTLYDVFINVRDDEKEHWKTLCNLVQYNDMNAVNACDVKSTQPTIITTVTEEEAVVTTTK